MLKRPYLQWFDTTLDIPVQNQGDDPASERFVPIASANSRSILGQDGNVYTIGDFAVNPRASKNIIWSSEGYNSLGNTLVSMPSAGVGTAAAVPNAQGYNNVVVPALTVAQKKATGSTATNIGTLLGASAPLLDFSPYRSLDVVLTVSGFSGGTSIQFEIDMADDAGTPNSVAIWKPAALTATQTMIIVHVGLDQPYVQTTAAPSSEPGTGFTAQAALPSGVLFYPVYTPLLPSGNFQWTIVGSFTTLTWTAFLYGKY